MVQPGEPEPAPADVDAADADAADVAADAPPEAPAREAGEPAAEPEAPREEDALREQVKALEAREKELTDRLARTLADFENFRRRTREETAQAAVRGKEQFVKALLPVLDNLDRALAHVEDEGLRLVAKGFHGALADQGVTMVAPEGEAFDARLHEAIAQEAREGVKSGTVLTVVEKGYLLDGRVVRPARVVVAA